MAKGESTFNLGKMDKKKRSFEPFKAGDYDLKLIGDTIEIRKPDPSKKPDPKRDPPVSYVTCGFEALGSASEEGGKNRRVYHSFYTRLKPGKDGIITPQCVDQIKGLADGFGDASKVDLKVTSENEQEVFSVISIKKYLESHDGDVVRARVGVQKGTKDYPNPRNRIEEFFEADEEREDEEDESEEDEDEGEESDDEGDEDEGDDEEDSDEDEDEDESEDDEEDDDEEEPAPKPKKKLVKKPLKKKSKK